MLVLNTSPNKPNKVSRYYCSSTQKVSNIRKGFWDIDVKIGFTILQTVDAVPGKRMRNFNYTSDEIADLLINSLIKKV
jgi:hypothetical protein